MRLLILFAVGTIFTFPNVFSAERTVTKLDDDGTVGTLRREIADAMPNDTIAFDAFVGGPVIQLGGSEIVIDKNLTIDASNVDGGVVVCGDVTGDGESADDSRVFRIVGSMDVLMRSLIIKGGRAENGDNSGTDDGDDGGGIYNDGGNLTMEQCTITDNSAGRSGFASGELNTGGRGGGIYNNAGTVTISQSTISYNRAGNGLSNTYGDGGDGGGIYSSGGTLTLEQCTIAYNSAGESSTGPGYYGDGGNGGGIFSNGASVTITQCTIALNRAGNGVLSDGDGGGIYNDASPTLTFTDSIVARNAVSVGKPSGDGEGPDLSDDTDATRNGVNLIGDNTLDTGLESMVFPAGLPNLNDDFVGFSGARLDPLLGPLEDNGGPTETMLPQPGSPAVDPVGGTTSGGPFATDQRGFDRIFEGIQDIGSLEVAEGDYEEDSTDAAVLAGAVAAQKAARLAALKKALKKLKKKLKNAKSKGQVAKTKKFKKKIKKVKKQIRTL